MGFDKLIFLDLVAQVIFDKKGFNILALDLRGVSSITDYVIIAEGHVNRHIRAIERAIIDAGIEKGIKPLYVEGEKASDWIVIDYGFCMIHLFLPLLREMYHLEELWRKAEIVDLKILTIG